MRQIINSSQVFASQNGDLFPQPGHSIETDTTLSTGLLKYASGTETTETIGQVAAILAIEVGLNDVNIWISDSDPAAMKLSGPTPAIVKGAMNDILINTSGVATSTDSSAGFISFNYVLGLTLASPSQTPIIFSRLTTPGSGWSTDDMYNGDGGHIGFAGGNVSWFEGAEPFKKLFKPDGTQATSMVTAVGVGAGSIIKIAGN